MVRPRVFLDFAIDDQPLGRVIFELFNDTAPRTCENFRALCTGEKGLSPSGHALYYKNSIVHRSIKDFMIQAGDFTKQNGTGGESIYGGQFADEDLDRPVDSEALLCMANRGPNTNGSQFFVTLRPCPHLNGKHVVFGRVLRGYEEVVKRIAELPTDAKNKPTVPVVITSCGELEFRRKVEKSQEAPQKESQSGRKSRSKRSKSRSRSPGSDSDHSRRRHKKRKSRKYDNGERHHEEHTEEEKALVPVEETEEEYDARLEREEKERIAAEKKKQLERLKQLEVAPKDGIRFKGRGRMKFIDPELSHRQ